MMGGVPLRSSVWMFNITVALLFALGATAAHADSDPDNPANEAAEAHRKQGNKYFRAGQYGRAVDEYQAGAIIEDAPIFFFNLGQSYRFANDPRNAIRNYKLYLSRGHDPERVGTSETKIRELQPAADEAERNEREERERERRAREQPSPQPQPPQTGSEPHWYADRLGWTLAGASLGGGLISGYLFLNAADLDDQANSEDRQDVRNQLRDKASTRRSVGVGVGVASGALLVIAIVRLALVPEPPFRAPVSSVEIGVSGDGVFVFGRF